jgi:hypothetical protein
VSAALDYALLADLLLVAHALVVGFVILGQAAILVGAALHWRWIRRPIFRVVHLLVVLLIGVVAGLGSLCPLTTWEYELRQRAGQEGGARSLVGRALQDLIYVEVSLETLSLVYALFALFVLFTFFLIPPRRGFAEADIPCVERKSQERV